MGTKIVIRGRKEKIVLAGGGRLYVPSHGQKRWVIGLKYEGESLLEEDNPKKKFDEIVKEVNNVFVLYPSKKHLNGIEIDFGPSDLKSGRHGRQVP